MVFSLYPSLFFELRDKRNFKNLQFSPKSLGAMLEYWYIEGGLLVINIFKSLATKHNIVCTYCLIVFTDNSCWGEFGLFFLETYLSIFTIGENFLPLYSLQAYFSFNKLKFISYHAADLIFCFIIYTYWIIFPTSPFQEILHFSSTTKKLNSTSLVVRNFPIVNFKVYF